MNSIIIFLCFLNLLIIVSPRQLFRFNDYSQKKFGYGRQLSMRLPPRYYTLLYDDNSESVPKEEPQNFDSKERLFEGDIKETPKITRNGMLNMNQRWPGGRVPYEISREYNAKARNIFDRAFQHYHRNTCIRFVPRTQSDKNFILIQPGSSCSSYIGMIGRGGQSVTIDINGCVHFGTVVHELMHALGFFHEQSRTDRDNYIQILWENINDRAKNNFNKYTDKKIQFFGQPYDYSSIMHYSGYSFSKNGWPTIITKNGGTVGQRNALSRIDIEEINKMYCAQGK